MPPVPMTIMPKTVRTTAKWVFILAMVVCCAAADPAPGSPVGDEVSRTDLHGMWRTESSCVDKSAGEAISKPGFSDKQWHKAEIPGTVVGALVTDKTLPDPNYGINLKSIPGADIGGEEPFSNRDMPANSPYRCSFWFRTEFESPKNSAGRESWLHFLGINYRANIWLNGIPRPVFKNWIRFRSCLETSLGCSTVVQAPSSAHLGNGWRKCEAKIV